MGGTAPPQMRKLIPLRVGGIGPRQETHELAESEDPRMRLTAFRRYTRVEVRQRWMSESRWMASSATIGSR